MHCQPFLAPWRDRSLAGCRCLAGKGGWLKIAAWSNRGSEDFCFVRRAISNCLILVSHGPAQVNGYVFDVFQF